MLSFNPIAKAEKLLAAGEKEKAAKLFARGKDFRRATRYYAEAGNEEKAIETAVRAVLGPKAKVESDSTLEYAAQLLVTSGGHKEAVPLFELAGKFELAAKSALKSRQKARAGQLYERGRHYTKAATCYEGLGRLRDVLRCLDHETRRLQPQGRKPEAVRSLQRIERKRAEVLAKVGRSSQAADLMLKAGPEARSGAVLEKAGRHREAVDAYVRSRDYDEALRLVEDQPDLDDRIAAEIMIEAGRPRQAARLYGAHGFTHEAAKAWEAAGDWLEAARHWEKSRQLVNAGEAYFKAEQYERAGRCFEKSGQTEKALDAYRRSGDVARLAACQLRLGRPLDAAASYVQARKYLDAAKVLIEDGKKIEAADVLRQVPASHPGFERANLMAGEILFEMGKFEQALHRIRLLSADVQSAGEMGLDRLYWEGRILEAMGKEAEAFVSFERLVGLEPAHRDAGHRLSDLRERLASTQTVHSLVPPANEDLTSTPAVSTADIEIGVGQTLAGRYQILEEIGCGGMGRVYRARDERLEEDIAIKTLLQQLGLHSVEEARLLREVKICRRLSHPNIVRVHDVRRFTGGIFITMELMRGKSLDRLIEGGKRLTLKQTKSVVAQIAAGLEEAHSLEIVHRDLKPANVFLDNKRIKILDFGIARMEGTQTQLTQTGHVLGSPHYMSPEQLQAHPIDGRSDIYSLGIVAYRLLAGREPFVGDTLSTILMAHLQQAAPDIRNVRPEVPESWVAFLDRMLAKQPNERFASVSELREALAKLPAELEEPLPAPSPNSPSTDLPTVDLRPPQPRA